MSKPQIEDFLQRWRMVIPNERLFSEFRIRVSTVVDQFISSLQYIDMQIWTSQPLITVIENKFAEINGSIYQERTRYNAGNNIHTYIFGAPGFLDLILIVQRLFWAIEEMSVPIEKSERFKKEVISFTANLNTAIDRSSGINLRRIKATGGTLELYPEGIKLMDDVVDENVSWLKVYPDVAKEFQTALTFAVSKDSSMYRQALDSLRFALEKLLKIVLGNNVSIEKQKEPLLKWMKEKGVHAQIRQNYSTLLTQFSLYQNTAVKHDNEVDPDDVRAYSQSELEYMIYLTSTLIRFLIETHRATGNS